MSSLVTIPLYSMPHFSFTITSFPVRFAKKGLGFTIYYRKWRRVNGKLSHSKYIDMGDTVLTKLKGMTYRHIL